MTPLYGMPCPSNSSMPLAFADCHLRLTGLVSCSYHAEPRTDPLSDPGMTQERRGEVGRAGATGPWLVLDLVLSSTFWGTGMPGMEDHCYHVLNGHSPCLSFALFDSLRLPRYFIHKSKYLRCLWGIPGERDYLQKALKVSLRDLFLP